MLRWDMAFDPYQLIDKKARKALTRRNDRIGLMHLGGHFASIGAGGYAVYLTYSTIFMLPAMWLHGIVLACLFAPMHECSQGTAFRTRWLNEASYWLVSLVYISQPTWYRYRHAVHHTYTQIQGKRRSRSSSPSTPWGACGRKTPGTCRRTTCPGSITRRASCWPSTAWSPAPRSISGASRRSSTG